MFDHGAFTDALTEGKLAQTLGETKVQRMGNRSDADGRARRGRDRAMISTGAFWGNSGQVTTSSGHDRFYYVRNVAPVSRAEMFLLEGHAVEGERKGASLVGPGVFRFVVSR